MPLRYKDRVKEVASNKPNASTAFNLPDSAPAGFQSFDAAYATGETMECMATNGTDWESFIGTFTAGTPDTLARTTFLASSTGSAIDWSSGGDVTIFVTASSKSLNQFSNLLEGITPGGRLTLESGVPISTADQTSKSTLYYTPYVSNIISLWDGSTWYPVEFAEVSLALSGLTSSRPYDVYAYLNAGVLALELLAWTSATARATAITLQDGRYCKSGNKTRLYIGSFYALTATTTEDSQQNRLVFNAYNQVGKKLGLVTADAGHTWTGTTGTRQYANNTAFFASMMVGIASNITVFCGAYLRGSATTNMMMIGWNYDVTNAISGDCQPLGTTTTTDIRGLAGGYSLRPAGYTKCNLLERSNDETLTLTASYGIITGEFKC